MTAVSHSRTRSLDLSLLRGGRAYLWLTLLSLIAAVVSLHWPSTPSYDPWSWLIWGREIYNWATGSGPAADGALHIAGGSSWKPLPVIFTTVFALFGSAQPNLWLVVARAGAALTVLMSVKLTARITWGLVASSRGGTLMLQQRGWVGRAVTVAPAVFAAAAVLICTTFTPSYPGNMLLGYSEGVMTAGFLVATERAWDGHYRQAFALGIIPCLDRPEVWPIWGLYGLWLMWRDRRARLLVVGLGVLMLALWIVPQKLGHGSGGIIGLATHAQQNRSAKSSANAAFPFGNELSTKLLPLVVARLELAVVPLIVFTAYLLVRAHRRIGSWRASLERHPAAVAGSLAGIFGYLWWLGIALETQAGFAGNPRYAVIGVMFICVSGCVAYGWACIGLTTILARAWERLAAQLGFGRGGGRGGLSSGAWTGLAAACTLVVLLFFALVPDRFTNGMPTVSSIHREQRYQAQLRGAMAHLIDDYGGGANVLQCGSLMANNLQVTMLAWYLEVPIPFVEALPYPAGSRKTTTIEPGPNVVFQDGADRDSPNNQGPTPAQMLAWERGWKLKNGTAYKIIVKRPDTLYTDCSAYNIYNAKH